MANIRADQVNRVSDQVIDVIRLGVQEYGPLPVTVGLLLALKSFFSTAPPNQPPAFAALCHAVERCLDDLGINVCRVSDEDLQQQRTITLQPRELSHGGRQLKI